MSDLTPCRESDIVEIENEQDETADFEERKKVIDDRHSTIPETKIPKESMEFETEAEAQELYNEYARLTGFGTRKHTMHTDSNGKVIYRTFVCACEGQRKKDKRPRPETRTNCRARMTVNARHSGKFVITEFVGEHNGHDLVGLDKVHLFRSHRSITSRQATQIDNIDKSGISTKAGLEYMSQQVGGRENIGFILEDLRNYLNSKRTRQMKEGDAGGVLNYLQVKQSDDPNFFHAIQIDSDDLIANIFWADGQMRADYVHFGDVVCFDTTYRKHKDGRPFALFVGVNHHKQTTVFGAALLYDETANTFMWLFKTFADAMNGKTPATILTDQDAAMAKALKIKWPDTCHRLCIWHIYQNAAIHLSGVFNSFPNFLKDFSSCIYNYDEEADFLEAWNNMLDKARDQNYTLLIRPQYCM